MTSLGPYLHFDGNAAQAFDFYADVFGGEPEILTYRSFGEGMELSEADMDKVAHVSLSLGPGLSLMASDVPGGSSLSMGDNVFVMVEPDDVEEAERVFAALAEGGRVDMAIGRVPFAERHGMCQDRFGVRWMVNYPGDTTFEPA